MTTVHSAPHAGRPYPLGSTIQPGGVNFSVHSKNSSAVELLLFDDPQAVEPARCILLDPHTNRTGYYWHVLVPGIQAGQLYAYRVHGPFIPEQGLRFDSEKPLLDPYSRSVAFSLDYDRTLASRPGISTIACLKSAVVDLRAYDWQGDQPLRHPFAQTVIYEMHVGGFTRHPNSGLPADLRGTYAGLVQKIPYLQALGVSAVELLPIFQFDPQDAPPGLSNYWGYSPISFFAPHSGYSARKDPLGPLDEFRDMVKALHRAGIEVILDVVYNHTAEGDEHGPTFCFRGLENRTYYILGPGENHAHYANYSGCGNTLNTNQSIVRRLIIDSLHHWVQVMHVDGFRFDLASILSRDEMGQPLKNPPLLWEIESDPILAGAKLIAEAWDAGGLYQVGSFIGDHWQEWNGRFRDDVRSFWKGDPNTVSRLATRLLASPDLYGSEDREPEQSINFVTSHDGFTLNDLVSYNTKHNEANMQSNRDGGDDNRSWNCGVEGPADDPEVEALRARQVRNLLATTLLSLGVPMLLMGDEVRRTQMGNNNAYCQDNEISWFDWALVERHAGLLRFTRELVQFRLALTMDASLPAEVRNSLSRLLKTLRFEWHGVALGQPDWAKHSHSLALTLYGLHYRGRDWYLHFIFNGYWEPLSFDLPSMPGWCRVIDTSLPSPEDICLPEQALLVDLPGYRLAPRSLVLLARPG